MKKAGGVALGLLVAGLGLSPVPAQTVAVPAAARSAFRWTGELSQGGLIRGQAPAGTVAMTLDGQDVPIAPDGAFLIGFDRDAGPTAELVATLADGRQLRQSLTVAPRAWRIERLDRLPKYPVPDPEFQRLRPPELGRIRAARAQVTDAEGWRQPLIWPVRGRISGLFGAQRIYRGEPGSYHSGTDIAAATGTIVRAPADGVVILAADTPFTLEGHLLMLDHGQGLNSAFLHLSRIDVRPGDHVRQGQPIGAVGATGRATGPHLHWSLQWRGRKLDPLLVTGPMG
ncbi:MULTISPECIES: M23 family metallopeptidase [unclassified Sphingomonas]|uniref:M23 family metallopeptidase n=1 Tax=unclassified Sphingomonas TaxID=196159 RepID=UPI00286728A2|nr:MULTISPECIES: M23 family metallopeptidase [unclassified Sphingomonas]MDR6114004.1 murein DD-endopeptidase MepM/ murein hydrolase activator NlpD [Sphingomonas sp. SORGH_AS_0789]MDR6148636.1 murein DD-endopeptidase MepM/ murein hydrolase activator NlpD [Sphingomonas sp. SORGH_AS_0742]